MRSGLIGGMVGAFGWLVLLGVALGDPVVVGAALAAGVLGVAVALRLRRRRPRRVAAGAALLWAASCNALALVLWYDRIPEHVLGISTGKGPGGLAAASVALAVVAFLGVRMIACDR